MVVLRCTAKLLGRIGPPEDSVPSSTILGDWYAAPLNIGSKRYVLAISERSRLPVLMTARDVKHLPDRFADALAAVLWGLDIFAPAVQREVDHCREVHLAKTNSRSHLGTLNDFANLLRWQLDGQPDPDLVEAAVALAHTPVLAGSSRAFFADQLTRQLLGG